MRIEATTQSGTFEPVLQLSVYANNKVGRLNEIIRIFANKEVHIMALSILDTTDSSIIRMIVDYPEAAKKLLEEHMFSFVQSELIAVELMSTAEIEKITHALVQAEINIHSIYPFIFRPNDASALAISLEDNELAAETLTRHQLRLIGQNDIRR